MININLRELALKNGITTGYQLQTLLGIQPSLAKKWFANDLKMINFQSLNTLCKYFNCLPNDILAYTVDDDAEECFAKTLASAERKSSNTKGKIDKSSNIQNKNSLLDIVSSSTAGDDEAALLSTNDVLERLAKAGYKLKGRTISDYVKSGILKPVKRVGTHHRFTLDEYEKFEFYYANFKAGR
jgi:DNA-binding Xre family transcriptional regulator